MKFFFFVVLAALAFALLGAVVMWLWNAILPDLLGLKLISYWQAVGLLVLSRLLFGSWKGGRGGPGRGGPHFKSRFMSMSEEERQAFKEQMRQRCAQRKTE